MLKDENDDTRLSNDVANMRKDTTGTETTGKRVDEIG